VIVDDPELRVLFDHTSLKENPDNTPAFSLGNRVTIRTALVPDIGKRTGLVLMSGLSYHEFGHVALSPSVNVIDSRLLTESQKRAFEILEEGRIEMLMQAKYSKLAKYFAYPVITYLVNDVSTHDTAFLLTHGRKYLPKDIRDMFRAKFAGIHGTVNTIKVAHVIDQYLGIIYPRDVKDGKKLIDELAVLLKTNGLVGLPSQDCLQVPSYGDPVPTKMDHRSQQQLSHAVSEHVKDQTELEESGKDGSGFREEKEDESDSEDDSTRESESDTSDAVEDESGDSEPDKEDEDGSSGQDGSSQGSGDVHSDGEYPGTEPDQNDGQDGSGDQGGGSESPGSARDSSNDASEDPNDVVSGRVSAGTQIGNRTKVPIPTSGEILDTLKGIQNEIETNEDVNQDVQRLIHTMDDSSLVQTSLAPVAYREEDVSSKMRVVSNNVRAEFARLWANLDSGWNYGSDSGRLNPSRAAMATSIDDYSSMYDSWDEGLTDSAGIELFICGDRSGSMSGTPVTLMSEAMWIIANACTEIDAKVTVTVFDNVPNVLYERTERVSDNKWRRVYADGGTMPLENFIEARKVFRMSEQPNKILVVVTDGEWRCSKLNYDQVFAEMPDVTKVLILVTDNPIAFNLEKFRYKDYFQVNAEVAKADEITPVIAKTVNGVLERIKH
jgi:hypothetical protein